ncbi:MAG: sigma-54 factor interaction domain-containing protein, partial [Bdellovibrionales bacterium]|nr:sigma-54 factor interaction domain-containing protein [Bdellovibrionales bacterium]NQZ20373.1 sigma-54 factor interaction domain-containing protein [Bdellovibrionales bacterium]
MSNTTFPGSPISAGAANTILAGNKVIHKSDLMKQVMRMVDRVAPSNASVLVLGESGTGKELLAHAIHSKSQRRDKPFVAINCGALRENLLESELFGHEKGAFTGAYAKKIGLAETASGGTLFLDEIGELSPGMQAKLLRFIQEGEIYRVGGKEPIKVDIRLISATNRELDAEVMKGTFREDLYYRINTITVHSPPLRRRKEDISLLVEHFLAKNTSRFLNRGRKM